MAGTEMNACHAESDRSNKLTRLAEALAPAADQAAHSVDVEVEHARMIVDVQLGERGLANAWETIQVNEAWHAMSLRRAHLSTGRRRCGDHREKSAEATSASASTSQWHEGALLSAKVFQAGGRKPSRRVRAAAEEIWFQCPLHGLLSLPQLICVETPFDSSSRGGSSSL